MTTRNYNLNYVSVEKAKLVNEILKHHGCLTENRVMILCPPAEGKTSTGIFLPETAKEELPRKGVLVQIGNMDQENQDYEHLLRIGQKVTFGLYAGKEITFENEGLFGTPEERANLIPEGSKFTILSCNEIIYIESNN